MSGIQETVVLALRKMLTDVETGKYGVGDDFDYIAFGDDVEDDVIDVAE